MKIDFESFKIAKIGDTNQLGKLIQGGGISGFNGSYSNGTQTTRDFIVDDAFGGQTQMCEVKDSDVWKYNE